MNEEITKDIIKALLDEVKTENALIMIRSFVTGILNVQNKENSNK